MPKRKRAAERKRQERHPKEMPGFLYEDVGVTVQTERMWAEREPLITCYSSSGELADNDPWDNVLERMRQHHFIFDTTYGSRARRRK